MEQLSGKALILIVIVAALLIWTGAWNISIANKCANAPPPPAGITAAQTNVSNSKSYALFTLFAGIVLILLAGGLYYFQRKKAAPASAVAAANPTPPALARATTTANPVNPARPAGIPPPTRPL